MTQPLETTNPNTVTAIVPGGNQLTVAVMGALYTVMLRGTPVLIPVVRGDGKHSRTHICTPNFGKDMSEKYGLKQHGDMRTQPCDVTKSGSGEITVVHRVTDAPETYPSGMVTGMRFLLVDGSVTVTATHTNTGAIDAPVNVGQHCYFNAPRGYAGTRVNGVDVSRLVETTGSVELEPENAISIPGMPDLKLTVRGFSRAVLWVGERGGGPKDQGYVCIEPVEMLPEAFGSPGSMIHPGASRTVSYTLSLV